MKAAGRRRKTGSPMRSPSPNPPSAAEPTNVAIAAAGLESEALGDDRKRKQKPRSAAVDGDGLRGPFDVRFAVGASIILWILLALIAISLVN